MSRSQYSSVLPSEIVERIRNIQDIYKIENVKLFPINKSYPLVSSESPRVEIYLPSDSVLNLKNSVLEAQISFNHRGNAGANAPNNYVQSVYPPRYALASLIEEFNVYINGISVSSTKRYNFIYNWVKDWLQSYDVELDDGLNENKDPSMIYQRPTSSTGVMSGRVVPRRGFPPSILAGINDYPTADDNVNVRNQANYHMNLGDSIGFFGEGSSRILNTALIGEIKIELIFTSQIACCILGSSSSATVPVYGNDALKINNTLEADTITSVTAVANFTSNIGFARQNVANNTNGIIMGDTGIQTLGNTNATRDGISTTGAIATETSVYQISNIILHIEAYQFKTSEYYDIMNRLVDSGAFKYHFKRYVLQTDTATTTRLINYRLIANSECLNYVLTTFRPAGYDTIANPLNTLISGQSFGHTGMVNATWKNQVASGLPYTFNQSKFFCRNGNMVARMGYRVDESYFEPRNSQEMYFDNLRHWRSYKGTELTRPHQGLKNIFDFIQCYYTGILSFEVKSDEDDKTIYDLRGLNTNGKPVAITIFTETEDAKYNAMSGSNTDGFSSIDLNPTGASIPTFLINTTCCLELHGKRNVDIRY